MVQLFSSFSIGLSCLYCVGFFFFFGKCEFTHLIALRLKESHVKLGIRNYFGCFNDLTFQKQVGYHWKENNTYLFWGQKQVGKDGTTQFYLTFHRKDRISLSNQLSMSDSELSIIIKIAFFIDEKNCKPIFISLKCLNELTRMEVMCSLEGAGRHTGYTFIKVGTHTHMYIHNTLSTQCSL